ncbi:transporter [Lutibacter sp. A80]|uniref:transporter n=1 Tax=Lutibacter sp. A80 TaxID=2918453 RepID=UPI001F070204|nr:transporter [Lutibacter sp. A80]UMB59492.1 transporter [Lutibacter sp. A80]
MKNGLFRNILLLIFFNIVFASKTYAQDELNKWVVGIGINAVDYFPVLNPTHFPGLDPSTGNQDGFFNEIWNAEDHWNVFAPKVNVTRYWKNRISLDVSFSVNKITRYGDIEIDAISYYAIDGNLQYSLVNPQNYFTPFIYAGGGYTFADRSGGTVNAGIGANYWFSDSFGVNAQGGYKYNSPDYQLKPHMFYSFSLVMKINAQRRYKWNSRKKFNWRNGR